MLKVDAPCRTSTGGHVDSATPRTAACLSAGVGGGGFCRKVSAMREVIEGWLGVCAAVEGFGSEPPKMRSLEQPADKAASVSAAKTAARRRPIGPDSTKRISRPRKAPLLGSLISSKPWQPQGRPGMVKTGWENEPGHRAGDPAKRR